MNEKKKTKLRELRERNPWKKPAEKKGRGRAQGKDAASSRFNTPISAALNRQRAEVNAVELQLRRMF